MKAFNLFCSLLFVLHIPIYSQWSQFPMGTSADIFDLHFITQNTGWVVGSNGTILKTTNGGNSWAVQQSNLSINIYSVCFTDSLHGWVCGPDGNILKTTNGGENWIQKPSGVSENINSILFVSESDGFAVTGDWYNGYPYSGRILKTTDGGETWTIKLFDDSHGFIDLYFYDKYNGWICGSNGATYKTTNGGNSWSYINANSSYWLFSIFYPSPNIGYVVGGNSNSDFISKSTNSGNTWNQIRESFQDQAMIGAYFINDLEGWVCGFNGVMLKTTNAGISWSRETLQTDKELREIFFVDSVGYCVGFSGTFMKYNYSQPTSNIQIISPNGGELWEIGSTKQILWNSLDIIDVKIEYSYNNGANWNTVVSSYPSTGVYTWTVPNIMTNQARVKISDIATGDFDRSDSIFRIIEPTIVSETFNNEIPYEYSLSQNFPNPFNPSTTIQFSLVKSSYVSLKLYNINGEEISSLIEGYKQAGTYSLNFEPNNLPSGIYLYRIVTEDFSAVQKMTYLK